MKRLTLGLAAALMLVGVGQAALIDTTGTWDGSVAVGHFGEPYYATFGQTFTLLAGDTQLDNFKFWVMPWAGTLTGTDPIDFSGYVMAWDGNKATGAVLFKSPMVTAVDDGSHPMLEFVFATGGLPLDPDQQYVAFVSATEYFDGDEGQGYVGHASYWDEDGVLVIEDVYDGGSAVNHWNRDDFSMLTDTNWGAVRGDLAFVASFSVIPEPSTFIIWSLLGALSISIGWWRRRR